MPTEDALRLQMHEFDNGQRLWIFIPLVEVDRSAVVSARIAGTGEWASVLTG
jgi:hypothetical protein